MWSVRDSRRNLKSASLLLNDETGEWEELIRTRYDEPSFSPAGVNGDGPNGYVVSNINPDGTAGTSPPCSTITLIPNNSAS